jgi:PAS domain-containing protein
VTIPSDDTGFHRHVRSVLATSPAGGPGALEARLRRLFPRVAVRGRDLSGEPPAWYVYRDGRWRPPAGSWWTASNVPHVVLGQDGWIIDVNPGARSLLGLAGDHHHFTDFVASTAVQDASILFGIVQDGHPLSATMLLRPLTAGAIACEFHAERVGDELHAWLRLAGDVELEEVAHRGPVPTLVADPADDVVFAGYAARQLAVMAEPSPDALALRLRRLYPHARVSVLDDDRWMVRRDEASSTTPRTGWWLDPTLPRVRYDDRGLITEANRAATRLLGAHLAGRHWQDLVTAGSQDQVQLVLDLLRETGEAVSRFRMPASDGRLVEFDSHTRLDGDRFETTMRPLPAVDLEAREPRAG